MSRLTDLIAQAKVKDPQMGADLDREYKVLSSLLPYGLNVERHRPEAVELPQRPVRKGDKVRVLPARGSTNKADSRLWQVKVIGKRDQARLIYCGHMEVISTLAPLIPAAVALPTESIDSPTRSASGHPPSSDPQPRLGRLAGFRISRALSVSSTASTTRFNFGATDLPSAVTFRLSVRSFAMLGYTLLVLFAALVLGLVVNGAFLYLAAAAMVWLVVMGCVWLWLVATGRMGFFGRR